MARLLGGEGAKVGFARWPRRNGHPPAVGNLEGGLVDVAGPQPGPGSDPGGAGPVDRTNFCRPLRNQKRSRVNY
ncbi:MAG: hypothetical protein ONB05_10180, partial [candidate division KSB1 bacterium]|nr:hypothetical protein [candidate division KSB1 bacterium]